jgi:hypothetical protein
MGKRTPTTEYVFWQETLYRNTGNPIHVWDAISSCRSARPKPLPLPTWCLEYLQIAAMNVRHLSRGADYRRRPKAKEGDPAFHDFLGTKTMTPKKATTLVLGALGLTRKGWNAFTEHARWMDKEIDRENFHWFQHHEGLKSEEAARKVMELRGLSDTSAARRRIAQALKVLPFEERET